MGLKKDVQVQGVTGLIQQDFFLITFESMPLCLENLREITLKIQKIQKNTKTKE